MTEHGGATVYGVEAAVWACFTGGWVALRSYLHRTPLEEFALIPAAAVAVCGLLATSMSKAPLATELTLFQVSFGAWFTLVYAVVEAFVTSQFAEFFLQNMAFAVASLAVSLAFSTIQTLITAAAIPQGTSVWTGSTWAKVALVLLTTLQAGTKHDTHETLAFAVIILWADFASVCLEPFQLWKFPLSMGIGLLSAQQILDIASVSLLCVSAGFAVGTGILSGRTSFVLSIFLGLPLAVLLYKLIGEDNFRAVPSAPPPQPHEQQPQQQKQQQPQQQPQQQQQQQQPQRSEHGEEAHRVKFPQIILPQFPHSVRPAHFHAPQNRPPPVNPQAFRHEPLQQPPARSRQMPPSAKSFQDAILFRHAGTSVPGVKKNI